MTRDSEVGLFLALDAEREILRTAALSCGLQCIDLLTSDPILHAENLPPLIVTDTTAGPWETARCGTFSNYDAPTLLLVSDQDRPCTSIASTHGPSSSTAPACVLTRPLSLDKVIITLRTAAAVMASSSQRHQALMDDLSYCRSIFNCVSNGITISDANVPDLPLTYVNPAFERMTGYSSSEVYGLSCRFLQGTDRNQPELPIIREALRTGGETHVVLRNYRKDGTRFWNELNLSTIRDREGRITHFVGIQNDVTQQIEATRQLEHLAHHDVLTGLANRGLLMSRLDQALQQARRRKTSVAVLYLDLNNFKEINDIFGHESGDRVLVTIADRLRSVVRAGETVARLGGDEFVVVLEDISADRQPRDVMQRLVAKLSETVSILGTEILPTTSVGLALFPKDGDTAAALLRAADFEMYLDKQDTLAHAIAEGKRLDKQRHAPSHAALAIPAHR